MPKVTTNFTTYRDTELGQKAQFIVNSLTNNARFPTPTPTLAALQAAIDAYQQALANMDSGVREATIVKNHKRDELTALLNQLALYAQMTGQNDEATLLSSGFDLRKASAPVGMLDKPENFKVEAQAMRGSVRLSLDKIKGASGYVFEYTTAPATPDSIWQDISATRANILVDGLSSGKQYVFRVTGIGADPTKVYSDELSSFVL